MFASTLMQVAVACGRWWNGLAWKSVRVDGDEWPFLDGGPSDSDHVVVLLHGFNAEKDHWNAHAGLLVKHCRVICPDLLGFGENARRADKRYDIAAQTERVHAFVCAVLGDTRTFHLGGNSMGGFISLQYALTHGERLASLALFAPAGIVAPHKSELDLAHARGENPLVASSPADIDRLLAFVAHKPLAVPHMFKQVLFEAAERHEAFLNQVVEVVGADARADLFRGRLGAISTPTLVVWGRNDRLLDVSCAQVLCDAIPHCRCVILDATGHVPMMERPVETAALQLELIRSL